MVSDFPRNRSFNHQIRPQNQGSWTFFDEWASFDDSSLESGQVVRPKSTLQVLIDVKC